MRIINFSDARNSLLAVVMSLDHYNSLMETVHLLSSPTNAAHLARSIAQARAGQATHRELLKSTIPE
jgi:antitoxin YefM